MEDIKYDFVYLSEKTKPFMESKTIQEHFMKWSMKGNIKLKFYNFNQPFGSQLAENFVQEFFCSPEVYSTLEICNYSKWCLLCEPCDRVNFQVVPCTVVSMDFFDRLLDPENKIVRSEKGDIIMKYESQIGDFYSSDNLRGCLLEKDTNLYKLYSESERNEFIFKLFFHFVLGGSLCQFEDNINPYLKTVQKVYKELISVNKITDKDEIRVRSLVLKVVAYVGDQAVCPSNPHNPQNFAYLIIDSFKRQVAILIHQYMD